MPIGAGFAFVRGKAGRGFVSPYFVDALQCKFSVGVPLFWRSAVREMRVFASNSLGIDSIAFDGPQGFDFAELYRPLSVVKVNNFKPVGVVN